MDYFLSRYISAAELLPPRLRSAAMRLDDTAKSEAEEIRLRVGRIPSVLTGGDEIKLDAQPVTSEDITEVAARAAHGSLHSVGDELAAGFITAQGGHRLGLCGRGAMEDGRCKTLRDFSSGNLRIAREVLGAADAVFEQAVVEGVRSTLILSPPGAGKTTLLRDLVRQAGDAGVRVSVADERGEIAACSAGKCGFDVGECTDVLSGVPKAYGTLALLRSMNPQVIALDEITDPADFDAVRQIVGCGAAVFATMHGASLDEALRRKKFDKVLPIFEKVAVIERRGGRRRVTVSDLPRKP